jgi:hypothetical protein
VFREMSFLGKKRKPRKKIEVYESMKELPPETETHALTTKPISYYFWNSLTLGEKLYVQFKNKQRLTNTAFASANLKFLRRSKRGK